MKEMIIIYRDGQDVISRYYTDYGDCTGEIKIGRATCSPDDKFDFMTGAKISFERLAKEDKPLPKPEEIRLYCAKDYNAYRQLTKGKIYKFTSGQMTYDDGIKGAKYSSWDEYKIYNGDVADCLVPLVKRPAKVGEWVLCTEQQGGFTCKGTIYRIEHIIGKDRVEVHDTKKEYNCLNTLHQSHYLVLDGYKPEPEKPKLYNAKVVCVKRGTFHTKGKTYKVVDGVLSDDTPSCYGRNYESVDEINDKCIPQFIELVE